MKIETIVTKAQTIRDISRVLRDKLDAVVLYDIIDLLADIETAGTAIIDEVAE